MGVDKPLKDFVMDTEQRYLSITFWVSNTLHWFWDRDYKRSSLDLENFESAQAGRKKSRNQEYKAAPAWIRSSGQIESEPGALPGFKCWRATLISLCAKFSEIIHEFDVVVLQKLNTS